jgi:hypothetical protein
VTKVITIAVAIKGIGILTIGARSLLWGKARATAKARARAITMKITACLIGVGARDMSLTLRWTGF